ncbi:hypothetical protein FRB99_003605, partial [Tulasnella sp. 403]
IPPDTHQEPPIASGQTPRGQSRLQAVLASLLRAIRTPNTRTYSPLQTQLTSMLAGTPELGDVVADVADLGGSIRFDDSRIHARAGNSDVYQAVLRPDKRMIAIKVLHAGNVLDTKELELLVKRLVRELRIWKALEHIRVTPLLGFAILPIFQVTEGLVFLHTHDPLIIHADIKAGNVLINDDGEAILCDFGLAKFLEDVPSGFTTSNVQKGTYRWMAPEQFREDGALVYTTETDVYAFGCLIL